MSETFPVLIYDGRCGFCRIWVGYWRRITGESIRYAAADDVADQYREISPEEFRRSVWLVLPDGRRFSGAEAVFELLATGANSRWPLRLYRSFPVFAWVCESVYRFIANHRGLFYHLTRFLWGGEVEPASLGFTRAALLRGLALVYLIAFASLIPQITGLIGSGGILPATGYLDAVHAQYGTSAYFYFPTLAWFGSGNGVLLGFVWAGILLAAALALGFVPLPATAGLYLLYLSVVTIGQTFFSFQWDALLLEAGFAAILLAPYGLRPGYTSQPSRVGIWVIRLIVFRLMLESGLVKLLSGDAAWRSLTALNYHYETQPLPTPLAWYAHHLPAGFQKLSVAGVFTVELLVPFLFLMPRRLRILGGWITIVFQLLIALTGNYTFFNLLAIVLCFSLFDDRHLRRFLARRTAMPLPERPLRHSRWRTVSGGALIAIAVLQFLSMAVPPEGIPEPLNSVLYYAEVFRITDQYGLFAVMTTSRTEIDIQGSDDAQNWKSYEFRFKPGDVHGGVAWIAPYQPRLDWQMWFAALSNYRDNPWFSQLMVHLLEGSPDVLRLLKTNPFPDKPPQFIRAMAEDFHFSDSAERRSSGAIWTRSELGPYFPVVSLKQ